MIAIIKTGTLRLPTGTVIKSKDYELFIKAIDVLTHANSVLEQVNQEAEHTLIAAKEKGYAAGLAEAKNEMFERQISIVRKSTEFVTQLERQIADTVMLVVRQIITDLGPTEALLQMVRQAMSEVISQPKIKIHTSADEISQIQKGLSDSLDSHIMDKIRVIASSSLKNGKCSIESPLGIMHLDLAKKLDTLTAALQPTPTGIPTEVD